MRVPSHVGISGNATADKTDGFAASIIPYQTTTNDIKYSIKYKIYVMRHNYWNAVPSAYKLKTVKKNPEKINIFSPPRQTTGSCHCEN